MIWLQLLVLILKYAFDYFFDLLKKNEKYVPSDCFKRNTRRICDPLHLDPASPPASAPVPS
jgi:hypothetical protein